MVAAGEELRLVVHRFRSGRQLPEVLNLKTQLAKKPLRTLRPTYATKTQAAWRGMKVDYWTAISPEIQRIGSSIPQYNQLKVAVSEIDHSTPVWNAGVRAGCGILAVEGRAIRSPDEFYREVQQNDGPVQIEILQTDGRRRKISIPPPSPSATSKT